MIGLPQLRGSDGEALVVIVPADFSDLAKSKVNFRAVPSPDSRVVRRSEAEVRRHACIWGVVEYPDHLHRVGRGRQDPEVSPSLQLLESLEIESVVYLIWQLSVHETLTIDRSVTRYRNDHLVLSRTDERVSYCTGFYLGHPILREQASLRNEHFAYLDLERFRVREAILDVYRERIAAHPRRSSAYYELALLIWSCWSLTRPNASYVTTQILPGPLEEALEPLSRAVELAPRGAGSWGLLGKVHLTLLRHDDAVRAYRRARELDPESPRWAFLFADALLAAGDEAAWGREIARANKLARPKGGRMDKRNAQTRYSESLERAADKLRAKVEHVVYPSNQELAEQDRAAISIRRDRVPAELRDLIPLAEKWGVGDDVSRGYLVEHAGREERQALARALHDRRGQVEAWLDSFAEGEMSDEAGYFMYMLEAAAEME